MAAMIATTFTLTVSIPLFVRGNVFHSVPASSLHIVCSAQPTYVAYPQMYGESHKLDMKIEQTPQYWHYFTCPPNAYIAGSSDGGRVFVFNTMLSSDFDCGPTQQTFKIYFADNQNNLCHLEFDMIACLGKFDFVHIDWKSYEFQSGIGYGFETGKYV
jgi:hypothetical protein